MHRVFGWVLAVVLLSSLPLAAKSKQSLRLFDDSVIGGTTLKAGAYQVDVTGSQLVVYSGKKEVARAPFRSETVDQKFRRSSLIYEGKNVTEVRLEGSNQKLLLEAGATSAHRD